MDLTKFGNLGQAIKAVKAARESKALSGGRQISQPNKDPRQGKIFLCHADSMCFIILMPSASLSITPFALIARQPSAKFLPSTLQHTA